MIQCKFSLICAVVFGETLEVLRDQAVEAINQGANLLEFRLDSLESIDFPQLKELINQFDLPIILGIRSQWNNKEIPPPLDGRTDTLIKLINLEPSYIELEYPIDMQLLDKCKNKSTPVLSLMDFEGMAKIAYNSVKKVLNKYHTDAVVKISSTPNSIDDLRQLWRWSKDLNKNNIKHVVIGMGQLGQISRIKSRELGNIWTYGRIGKKVGEPYLPGMLSIPNLKNSFADNAWHLASLGQLPESDALRTIYTELLKAASLPGIFLNIPIQTSPELDQMLLWAEDGLLDGFNINSPWQLDVLTRLDTKNASVVQMGSCNCVEITKDGLKGYNTQIEGMTRTLEPFSLKRIKRVYIEGTERIAKAVILALRDHVETIVVRNELFSEKDQIFYDFPEIIPVDENYSQNFDLIVNCTLPDKGFENVIMLPKALIENAKIIFDPMSKLSDQTPLIKTAIMLDKKIIDGFQFFLNTALSSFEIWTKRSIPSSTIKREVFNLFKDQIDYGFMLNY